MAYEGHVSKRQRTDTDGYGEVDNRHQPPPSPVVHVRGLADTTTENDLIAAVQHFGSVSCVMVMPRKRQALIQFEDIKAAEACVEHSQASQMQVGGHQAYFNYSTSQKIQRQDGGADRENKVLLFTVLNPLYPITVDVMHTICSANGQVLRIVVFKKSSVQSMVEFDSVESARRAKNALNGADIYSGCCTLKIDYARPTTLNVVRNDSESWDYTNPSLGKESPGGGGRSAPLLAEPRYGSAPTPYGKEGRGRPGPDYGGGMDYQDQYEGGYGRGGRGQPPPPRSYQDPYGQPPDHGYPPPRGGPYGPGGPDPAAGGQGPPGPGMYQQGAVLMVYGLNAEKMNCTKLFNLFCLYGNVVRVKFLKSKEGVAMIQLGDQMSCDRALKNLNNIYVFGSIMTVSYSKQAFLQDVPNPNDLSDGSPSFMDFMGNRNNRFTTPEAAQKNRIQPPAKVLHYFNAPPNVAEETLREVFENAGVKPPSKIKQFPTKSERSSTGLLEWENKGDALDAIVTGNHAEIPNPGGKRPYTLKLCFSMAPIKEFGGGRPNSDEDHLSM